MKTWIAIEYSRIKAKKKKSEYTNITATPNHYNGQADQVTVGLENISKELNIILALTLVETALANGGWAVYRKKKTT